MRRRRTLVGALAAGVVAGALVVVVHGPGGSANASSVSVPACHGSQLVGAVVRSGVWTGNLDTLVFVTNASDATCRLSGFPTLVGVRDGQRVALRVTSHVVVGRDLAPTTLLPRMSGAIIFGTGNNCPALNQRNSAPVIAAHTYTSVILTLPRHGGTVTIPGINLDTACYLSETQLGWVTPFPVILPS